MALGLLPVLVFLSCVLLHTNACGRNGGGGGSSGSSHSYHSISNDRTSRNACFGSICRSYTNNKARGCDEDHGCGYYNAPRRNRLHKGVDVKCDADDIVYAPFDGKLVRDARPYNCCAKECCNKGIFIEGTGDFNGWTAYLFYVERTLDIGSTFTKGNAIGTHLSLHCVYDSSMTDHVHIQLYKPGAIGPVDPTRYVFNC